MKNRLILLLLGNHGLTGCNIIGSIATTDIDLQGQGIEIVTKAEQIRFREPERYIPFTLKEPICVASALSCINDNSYEKEQTRMRNKFHRKSRWK